MTNPLPWSQVEAGEEFKKLPAEQKEVVRTQYFEQVVAPQVPKERLKEVRDAFDQATLPKGEQSVGPVLDRLISAVPEPAQMATGIPQLEAGLRVASQMAAGPIAGVASLYGLATAPPGLRAKTAADNAQAVSEAMTYQPRSSAGKGMAQTFDTAAGLIPAAAEKLTGGIAENPTVKKIFGNTGGEVLQGLANTAIQAIPTLLGVKGAKATAAGKAAAAAETPAARAAANTAAVAKAKEFAETKAGLKWDQLSQDLKDKLTLVAKHAPEQLDQIKPQAVARQARLEEAKTPATRGQIERDVAQLTHEDTLSKSDTGKPIRDIRGAQDTALHGMVDEARKTSGAKAETRESVGKSVESALRGKREETPERWTPAAIAKGLQSSAKAVWSTANYKSLFRSAEKTEPTASVSPQPFLDMLKKDPDIQHLGWMQSWLKKAKVEREAEEPGPRLVDPSGKPLGEEPPEIELRNLKLNELVDLREKAGSIAKSGQGSEKYYAGQVVDAIDKSMATIPAAAKAWRAAFDAFKQHKVEFEDQTLVNKLTEMKSRTDPVTAMEDTADTIRGHSAEDIRNLQKTLLKGGTEKTRAAGMQAWKDIQGSILDYLREKADPKEEEGAEGQAQFNKGFRKAFIELDKNGKIDALFSPAQAKALRTIAKITEDVRTRPNKTVEGSDTAANLAAERDRKQLQALTLLEKTSKLGKVGTLAAGAAKWLRSIKEGGQAVKDVATAKRSRLDEASEDAQTLGKKKQRSLRRSNTLRTLRGATAGTTPITLKDEKKRQGATE